MQLRTVYAHRLMFLRSMFAALHLLALGMGLGAIWSRSRALREPLDTAGLNRVFAADAWWGLAALLWLATGLVRVFSGLDKGPQYYATNYFFWSKMLLFFTVVGLEVAPMRAFMRWRTELRRGEIPDTTRADVFATSSRVQAFLIVLIVLAATAMARGLGIAF
jgi:putative membrane protein